MELETFISQAICSTLRAIKTADTELQSYELGRVWRGDFDTLASDLVGLRLAKGKAKAGSSVPVLLMEFDLNTTVDKENKQGHSGEAGLHIQVVRLGAGGQKEKRTSERAIQNLKFTVPVGF